MRNVQNLFALPVMALLASFSIGLCTATKAGTEPAAPAQAKSSPAAASQPAKVLSPKLFFGETQDAYEAAQECPDLIANLFCYCGCDITDHHTSLLDCFTTDHSADCQICREEVFIALGMKKQGKTLAEIQRAIDEKFEPEYIYDKPSPALLKYRAARKWQPASSKTDSAKKTSDATPPRLKPGKKAGDCCGGKNHSAGAGTKS